MPDLAELSMLGVGDGAGRKLLATLALLALVFVFRAIATASLRRRRPADPGEHRVERRRFWMREASKLVAFGILVVGVALIWFDDPARFATVAGLLTAGIAVALQRVITAFAGYFIILRGRVFTVGDRITIGGVRGDVVALGFIQTSVMEMGEPPNEDSGEPNVWVNARQYTGRVVNITNDKIFDTPVFNYTREFPYLWEEMHFPIGYGADRARAEEILLDVGRRHTGTFAEKAAPAFDRLRERYFVSDTAELTPRVFLRMTDNWLEVTLRFLAPVRGVRGIKDVMTREILPAFEEAKISIASTTFELTGVPVVRIARAAHDGA
jgi:small-conductance mechanosensitive channel